MRFFFLSVYLVLESTSQFTVPSLLPGTAPVHLVLYIADGNSQPLCQLPFLIIAIDIF